MVRVFLMKVQSSTDRCVGAALLLQITKSEATDFFFFFLHERGSDILDNVCRITAVQSQVVISPSFSC